MKNRIALALATLLLSACDALAPAPTAQVIIVTSNPANGTVPQATVTAASPLAQIFDNTASLAARVNGEDIPLSALDAELTRAAAGIDANTPDGQQLIAQLRPKVLDALIQRALIAQEAAKQGVLVNEQQIDDEIAIAQQRSGGDAAYAQWLQSSQLSEQDARDMARHDLLTNALRDRVLSTLPKQAEYLRAFHILVATEGEAQQVLAKLDGGAKFGPLARQLSIDPSTAPDEGDLDWFAQGTGTILWPEVEAAAFSLQPGETSPIVQSPVGFHVIRVTGREMRPLSEADLAALQQAELNRWLDNLLASATVERFQ
jgi:parvulin-like peptidyl-prolyl isomerase